MVLRTLGSMRAERYLAGGAGESALMASSPSALGDRWWERGCNCTALSINTLFLWCSRLFPQTFLLVELLTPVPSGTVPPGNSCSLPGSVLPTSLFSNQSTSTTGDLGWDVQGCSTDNVFNFYFVLPSEDHQLCYLLLSWKSFPVPAAFPTIRVLLCWAFLFVWVRELSSSSAPCRVAGPFSDSSFLYFILSGCKGIFLVF